MDTKQTPPEQNPQRGGRFYRDPITGALVPAGELDTAHTPDPDHEE